MLKQQQSLNTKLLPLLNRLYCSIVTKKRGFTSGGVDK